MVRAWLKLCMAGIEAWFEMLVPLGYIKLGGRGVVRTGKGKRYVT